MFIVFVFVLQLRMIFAAERRVRNNMIVKIKRKRQNGKKSLDSLGFFCFVFVCLFSFLYSYNDSTDRHSFQSNGMGKNPKTDCKFSCLFSLCFHTNNMLFLGACTFSTIRKNWAKEEKTNKINERKRKILNAEQNKMRKT